MPRTVSTRDDQRRDRQEIAPPSTKGLIPHWTGVFDATGRCRYSVPPAWTVERRPLGEAAASAPDGNATAQLEWTPSSSWIASVLDLRRMLKPTLTLEDSGERFWCEYRPGWPGVHSYVAVPAPGGLCATWIDVRAAASGELKPIVRQIIQSVVAIGTAERSRE
jgi:hypothetical protein